MRLYLATVGTPFIGAPPVIASNEDHSTAHNNNSNDFNYECYNKEKLSGDLLEADLFDPPIDDTMHCSMFSSSTTADTEQLQKPKHESQHKNPFDCCQELKLKMADQQELHLLPEKITKNIFNSESPVFICTKIPQTSPVQSFVDVNASLLATNSALTTNSFSVDTTVDILFEQTVQDPYSYRLNSKETAPPSTASFFGTLDLGPTVEASTTLLEAAVNSKRRIVELRQQNRIEDLNFSTSMFLDHSRIPLVRGRSFGGNSSRPPKTPLIPGTRYVTARLRLENSTSEDICLPHWNKAELKDSRRIIRIERRYQSNEIVATFSIVGSAIEHPKTKPAFDPDVKVLEVSCLKCPTNENEPNEERFVSECTSDEARAQHALTEPLMSGFNREPNGRNPKTAGNSIGCRYYITSVEVIKIIELLIGSYSTSDPVQRRKERGRIRSNLVQFWSKHLVFSSKNSMKRRSVPTGNDAYLTELEHRINTYDVRKPRLFDKSVKILEWSKLGPALRRAIQSYYMVRLDESSN
ncbi:Hypothetical protein PP7435_CHR4-1012 [Komagataella phaffii CBS 7435]|uniref:DUF7082 domain-containing protein n=1 Tax=Komagataella phaffii (strain ATCC 76273 / CBS 7435 / CECT 11047 / NRRL Y-11430 / Wegner 21-1) TaxID=981350 RepID=F2R0I3_KOMPC|nr:GQ67_04312T0 [Komagataella phaffii]AOA70062.1 GQ68_04284T0 [Komagataella phaffii GS115]CAH2451431.1 Hypothetical protein BQ9382_C4-5305 [Komagataella phaffii CBS 7435]CCA41161.1 Hypothetical protein PP7435_CHR4-1012 [Komagataella phaffii CBS 7435]